MKTELRTILEISQETGISKSTLLARARSLGIEKTGTLFALTEEEVLSLLDESLHKVGSPSQTREVKSQLIKGLRSTHKGNFLEAFGIDVDCYILNDESHSAVIHQRGMNSILGLAGGGGSALRRFINGKTLSSLMSDDLIEKLEHPIIFSVSPTGQIAYGYDVSILIDICKVVIDAKHKNILSPTQEHIFKQAQIIVNGSAKSGITGLVYALSGYNPSAEQVIASFKMFVQAEASEYESEFPNSLYREWYRLYEIPKPERNHPWKFMHLTMNQVYYPLAKSSGQIRQLLVIQKTKGKNRNKKLFQFLSEIGRRALRQHLGQLLGIAQISENKTQYEQYFNKLFGDQPTLPFINNDI